MTSLSSANAVSPVTVKVQAVHPLNYGDLGSTCGISSTTTQSISYGVIKDNAPVSYSTCSYLRAVYKATDNTLLPIVKIEDGGNNTVIVTPDVPAGQADVQKNVVLTLPASQVSSRIILQYGDNSRALPLQFQPQGGASSVALLDTTLLSENRTVRVGADSNGKFTYVFRVEVPRSRSLTVTANGSESLTTLSDDSTTTKTVRTYQVVYPANTDKNTKTITVNASTGNKTVPVTGRSLQTLRYAGWNSSWDYNAYYCDQGACRVYGNEPVHGSYGFFYSVLDSKSGTIGRHDGTPTSSDVPLGHRYGISGVRSDIPVWASGWDTDGSVPYNGGARWGTIEKSLDYNNTAPYTGEYAEYGKAQNTMPYQVTAATQDYGESNQVQFYVQNDGVGPAKLGAQGVTGASRPFQQEQFSWFLQGVRVNNQVLSVPFPDLQDSVLRAPIADNSTSYDTQRYGRGVTALQHYQKIREHWLGGVSSGGTFPQYMHQCSTSSTGGGLLSPKQYAKYEITTGENAGTTVTVELVNARTVGDLLAAGYSASWSGGNWAGVAVRRQFGWNPAENGQFNRYHPYWFNGPAMQMLDTSSCVQARNNDGSDSGLATNDALNNQWKTLYRVTISGMAADRYDVDVIWGHTSQTFVYNGGGQPVAGDGTIRMARNSATNLESLAGPKRSDAAVNVPTTQGMTGSSSSAAPREWHDNIGMSSFAQTNGSGSLTGDVYVPLKDGYKKPQIEVRGQDAQGNVTTDTYDLTRSTREGAAANEFHGKVTRWSASDSLTRYGSTGSRLSVVGLSPSATLRTVGDVISVPVFYLSNSLETTEIAGTPYLASSTKPELATNAVVPSQWAGTDGALSPQWANKTDAAYQQVKGAIPTAPAGKVFAGYKAYGVKFSTDTNTDMVDQAVTKTANGDTAVILVDKDAKGNQLLGRNLYPGDTIDIGSTYDDGTYRVRLSNDTFTAARVDAVWLSPVFVDGSNDNSNYYDAINVARTESGDQTINTAFSFVAAPGLTAKVASGYQPLGTLTDANGATYRHTGPDVLTSGGELGTNADSGIKFIYTADHESVIIDKSWVIGGTTYADGAQPNMVSATPAIGSVTGNFGEPMEAAPFNTEYTLSESILAANNYKCTLENAVISGPGFTDPAALTVAEGAQSASINIPNNVTSAAAGSTVAITYAMASADPDRPVPETVKNVLTTSSVNASYGTLVVSPALSQYRVEDPNGTGIWIFQGWSAPVVSATRAQTVTGRWEYTEEDVSTKFAVGYQWALPDSLTGAVPDELEALPAAVKVYDGNNTETATKPADPTQTTISTAQGNLVFEGWTPPIGAGQTWVGTWELAPTHAVKYAWTVTKDGNTVNVDPASYIGSLLTASLPANESGHEGQTVQPAGVLNSVVNYRTGEVTGLGWGSLLFSGWDKSGDTIGTSDVTFTARFVAEDLSWIRGIALTNTVATGTTVTIPASIDRQMQGAITPTMTAVQNSQTGLAITPWKAPDWSGQSYRDDANHGYWMFNGFTYTAANGNATTVPDEGIKAADFPKGEHAGEGNAAWGTDENIYRTGATTTGTLQNKALPVQAVWTFRADPVYKLTNTVKCDPVGSIVKFTKMVENASGWGSAPGVDAFTLRLTDTTDANKVFDITHNTSSTQPVPAGSYAVSEVAAGTGDTTLTQIWKPSTVRGKGYSCKDASDDEKVSDGTLTVPADGGTLTCSVTNNAAVVSLVTYDEDLAKFIASGDYGYDLVPVNESDNAYPSPGWQAKSEIEKSTGFITPSVPYKLSVTKHPIGTNLKLERYTGDVASYNDAAAATADTWAPVRDMNNLKLQPNKRTIYRVSVSRFHPTLPLTGGHPSDLFIILGVLLATVAGTAMEIHRRRKARLEAAIV